MLLVPWAIHVLSVHHVLFCKREKCLKVTEPLMGEMLALRLIIITLRRVRCEEQVLVINMEDAVEWGTNQIKH